MSVGSLLKSGANSLLGRSDPSDSWQRVKYGAMVVPGNRCDLGHTPGVVDVCIDDRYGATRCMTAVRKPSIKDLLSPYGSAAILRFVEWREKNSEFQAFTLVFYHEFIIMEIEGGIAICVEEYNGKIEVMCGFGDVASFASQYHSDGTERRSSTMQQPCTPSRTVLVLDLLQWLSSPITPPEVEERGVASGLKSFLEAREGSDVGNLVTLAQFLDEDRATLSKSDPPTLPVHSESEEANLITLIIVLTTGELDEAGSGREEEVGNVKIEPWKKISEVQSAAELALGKPLARLLTQSGRQLDPASTIYGCDLVDGDSLIAELFSGVE